MSRKFQIYSFFVPEFIEAQRAGFLTLLEEGIPHEIQKKSPIPLNPIDEKDNKDKQRIDGARAKRLKRSSLLKTHNKFYQRTKNWGSLNNNTVCSDMGNKITPVLNSSRVKLNRASSEQLKVLNIWLPEKNPFTSDASFQLESKKANSKTSILTSPTAPRAGVPRVAQRQVQVEGPSKRSQALGGASTASAFRGPGGLDGPHKGLPREGEGEGEGLASEQARRQRLEARKDQPHLALSKRTTSAPAAPPVPLAPLEARGPIPAAGRPGLQRPQQMPGRRVKNICEPGKFTTTFFRRKKIQHRAPEGRRRLASRVHRLSPRFQENVSLVLHAKHYKFIRPPENMKTALLMSKTYAATIYVPAELTTTSNIKLFSIWIRIGNLPLMTNRGHFIINGTPRVVLHQLVRSPGVYYHQGKNKKTCYADIICRRGVWLRIEMDKKGFLWLQMKNNVPKIPILTFLQTLGAEHPHILSQLEPRLIEQHTLQNEEQPDIVGEHLFRYSEHAKSVFNPIVVEIQRNLKNRKTRFIPHKAGVEFLKYRLSSKNYDLGLIGRQQINKKFGLNKTELTLTLDDLVCLSNYFIDVKTGKFPYDDIDHLKNRRVKCSGELIQEVISEGLREDCKPALCANVEDLNRCIANKNLQGVKLRFKQLENCLKRFFNSSPLSQFLDQTNCLAEITHKRRLSSLGPGGVTRETAGMKIRGIHPSHYGRICPIETPEGPNAGLVNSLTTYAKINKSGFLETPYYRVENGQVQDEHQLFYVSADQDEGKAIAPPDLRKDNLSCLMGVHVPIKIGSEFSTTHQAHVDFMSISRIQMISVATSLIPFLEHNDANRALMGSNMQRQSVPVLKPERAIVGTGLEGRAVSDSGHSIQARESGLVTYASSQKIQIFSFFKPQRSQARLARSETLALSAWLRLEGPSNRLEWAKCGGLNETFEAALFTYPLQKYTRSNQNTSFAQRPLVLEGQWVQKGECIADCTSSAFGELAIGKNVLVAYLPWEGYNFEDAILVSERLIFDDLFTSVHIVRYSTEIRETKFGLEQITMEDLDRAPSTLSDGRGLGSRPRASERFQIQPQPQPLPSALRAPKAIVRSADSKARAHKEATSGRPNEGSPQKNKAETQSRAATTNLHIREFTAPCQNTSVSPIQGAWRQNAPKPPSSRGPEGARRVKAVRKPVPPKFKDPSGLETRGGRSVPATPSWVRAGALTSSTSKALGAQQNQATAWPSTTFHSHAGSQSEWKARVAEGAPPAEGATPEAFSPSTISNAPANAAQTSAFDHLDMNGIVKIGTWVTEGDILVRKVTPIGKKQLSPYQKFLYAVVEEPTPTVKDTSLRVPKGMEGRVIDIKIRKLGKKFSQTTGLPREGEGQGLASEQARRQRLEAAHMNSDSETHNSSQISRSPQATAWQGRPGLARPLEGGGPECVVVWIAEKKWLQVGDKMAGRHGNKGIVSRILPRQDMPYLPDGTPVDMVLNPLGVPSRMNVGQIFESLLGLAGKHLNQNYKVIPFDEVTGPEASRSLTFSKLYEASQKTGKDWLFQVDHPGKMVLFDGRTGIPFDQPITVGQPYMLKLIHLVDEKIHARSTGPYSLVTQQPLRGRSKMGGQRFGEMEVWALEGFGAAYTLQEILTIKSDDIYGRKRIIGSFFSGKRVPIGQPESFRVLVRELQALCITVNIYPTDPPKAFPRPPINLNSPQFNQY